MAEFEEMNFVFFIYARRSSQDDFNNCKFSQQHITQGNTGKCTQKRQLPIGDVLFFVLSFHRFLSFNKLDDKVKKIFNTRTVDSQ